jgi:nickel-dependent lactate racemase
VIIDFPYPGYEGISAVEVPDRNVVGIYAPRDIAAVHDDDEIIAAAIADPIGAPRLRDIVDVNDRVLILVDDVTRGTPIASLFPHVLAELEAASVPRRQISVLTAQGTHRQMTTAELREKIGQFSDELPIYQHEWRETQQLRAYGRTSDGTLVEANRLLGDATFVLGLGSIAPHRIAGFSGGGKIAIPGVAGPAIQERCHWEAAQHPSQEIMGVADNPIRLRIEEAARLVGLRYIVNSISGPAGLVGCVAGDPVTAHREGCRLSRDINAVTIRRRADIVIVDSHPADRDLWQSAKGMYSGSIVVRDGGILILVAPNPEGVAARHPIVLEIGYRPVAELARLKQDGRISDGVGLAILADISQIVDRVECFAVSPGMRAAEAQRLGVQLFPSAASALDAAFDRHGRNAEVVVLQRGGHLLPIMAS